MGGFVMGLFSRKAPTLTEVPNPFGIGTVEVDERGRPQGSIQIGSLGLDDDYETEVVGESHYREALLGFLDDHELEDGWDEGRVESSFDLVPEPSNPHDRFAVRVQLSESGELVGYLPRGVAAAWQPRLVELMRGGVSEVWCSGVVMWRASTGDPREDDRIPVGVRLDLVETPPG